jgi:hypothetical protein
MPIGAKSEMNQIELIREQGRVGRRGGIKVVAFDRHGHDLCGGRTQCVIQMAQIAIGVVEWCATFVDLENARLRPRHVVIGKVGEH